MRLSSCEKGGIAACFRQRFIDADHDGIVYGNDEPGERVRSSRLEANLAATAFHPDQIEITGHHLLGQRRRTAQDAPEL